MGNLELHGYDSDALVGTKVASFEILQCLGEGGMGAVYLAKQDVPRRKVALKVVKPGMDSKQVLTRFRLEQENLGLMNHPSIAAVYEAGLSDQGRPYFAMEWVDGLPIDTYCKQHKLSIRDRLALIVQVGKALQYAHQRGIIHRDIKPANILVTEKAGKPLVKIIDFGISKAIYRGMDPNTLAVELSRPLTTAGMVVGTIGYMSPEQACADESEVDTRTDVYALGALAYELLVGRPPFLLSDFPKVPLPVVLIKMQSQEPVKPSSAVYKSGEVESHLQSLGLQSPHKFKRVLKGDLEWIVMKALSREKDRRYSSVGDCIEDVERYLEGRPVSAGPVSLGYLLGKWVRRHKLLVTVGSTVLLVLLGAGVQTYLAEQKAQEEAIQTRETLRLMTEFLTEVDPDKSGKDLKVITLLDDFYQKVEKAEHLSKESQATLYQTIGKTYYNLGSNREALPILQKAFSLVGDSETCDDLQLRYDLGNALLRSSRPEEVILLASKNIELLEKCGLNNDLLLWRSHAMLGFALVEVGDLERGSQHIEKAYQKIVGFVDVPILIQVYVLSLMSNVDFKRGDFERSLVWVEKGISALDENHFVQHRYHFLLLVRKAQCFFKLGKVNEAYKYFVYAEEAGRKVGILEGHRYFFEFYRDALLVAASCGACEAAEQYYLDLLGYFDHLGLSGSERVKLLFEILRCHEEYVSVESLFADSFDFIRFSEYDGLESVRANYKAFALNKLAYFIMSQGDFDLAKELALEAIEVAEKEVSPDSYEAALCHATMAEIFYYSGDVQIARDYLKDLLSRFAHVMKFNEKVNVMLMEVKRNFNMDGEK